MFTAVQHREKYSYIIFALLIVGSIVIRLPILSEPWGADQSEYGYVAKGILEGKVPFRDMYVLTGYGVFFTYALFFKLFGMNMISIHIGHLIVSVVTVTLVFFLTRRLYGNKAAYIAALCYTVFANGLAFSGFGYENKSAWGTYWYLSQREVFMAPLMLGAVYLMVLGEKKNGMLLHLANGILIGLAAFYKITAILMLLIFIIFIIVEELLKKDRSFNFKKAIADTFWLMSGFIIIQLPFLYYFWIHDALKDVYEALFVHVSTYAKISRGLRIEALFSGHYSVLSENYVLWLFAAISCLYIIFRERNRNNILIVLWSIGSLIMVWGQGKFFGYHFVILVPPFAVLSGYGMLKFLGGGSGLKGFAANNFGDIRRTFMLVTILMSIMGFCISNYVYYKRHVDYYLGKMSRAEYYNVFNEFPTHPYSFPSDYKIVKYLRENAEKGDKLGVLFSSGDSVIHFLTGLEPATRFVQNWFLFIPNEVLSKDETTINLRKEYVEQIINTAPRFFLVVHIPLDELVALPYLKEDPNLRRLNEFIHSHYSVESYPSNRFLYRRLDLA